MQIGQRLLNTFGGLWGLYRAPFDELVNQHRIGEAKAAQVKSAVDLGRRLLHEAPDDRTTINSPADAAALVQYEMSALEQASQAREFPQQDRGHRAKVRSQIRWFLRARACQGKSLVQANQRIDADYNGSVFNITLADVLERKNDLVEGKYTVEAKRTRRLQSK